MLGGLISAALKGAGEGYSTYAKGEMENQQKLDYAQQLMQMQEEKDLRVDEIMRNRNIQDIGRKTTAEAKAKLEAAPIQAQSENAHEQARLQGALDSDLPELRAQSAERNYDASRPLVERQAKDKGTDTATEQTARTQAPGYLQSVAQESNAKESTSSKAQGALANFQLTQLKAVADLRSQLSKLPQGDPKREEITQQIQDLQLGTSTKSYSDVVTAAEGYRKMADNLRRDADKITDSDEERKAMLLRAAEYEQQADYILRGAVGKRLPGTQAKPAAGNSTPAASGPKPWERSWNTPAPK